MIRRIVAAGLLGGLVDFTYACVVALAGSRTIQQLWQGVASGWLGRAARDMGWASAGLGVLTHFAIAIAMAAVYALAATRLQVLTRRPVVSGIVYGLILYLVMYGMVLPLRFGARFPRWDGPVTLGDIAAHIGVALVIALVLARGQRLTPRP